MYPDRTVGALTIEKLSLVDDPRGTATAYGSFAAFYAAPEHWRPIAVDPAILAFENRRVLPRAWFSFPVASDEIAAVKAIRGGLLNGGRFEARRDVMTEAARSDMAPAGTGDRVRIVEDDPERQTFTTSCARACFLVVRDAFDPQWRVAIDGQPGTIVPADVALRGVAVPPGSHRVAFTFVPTSLYAGIALTAIAAICLLILTYGPRFRRKSRGV